MQKNKVFAKVKKGFDSNYQQLVNILNKKDYQKFVKTEFKRKTKSVSDLYFSQKALLKGASTDLPYQTLVLVGELLSHPGHHHEMEKIIESNILKSKGEFLKLDDPYQQGKIRKALKTFQFESCNDLNGQTAA